MTTELDYVSGASIIPEGAFGISPSGVSRFMSEIHNWYRTEVLGEVLFMGNTASVLGTCVHYCCEQYATTGTVNKEEVYKYIYKNSCVECPPLDTTSEETMISHIDTYANHPNIDGRYILSQWKPMGMAAIELLKKSRKPFRVEDMICAEVIPGFYASGSVDMVIEGTPGKYILRDWKTTSDKSPKQYIPMNYKYQLLTYSWIYRKLGIPIEAIQIVWITNNEVGRISEKTGKPLQDYPSQAVPITEPITDSDFDFIESILKLIAETVQAAKDYPNLLHILFKDYRLKEVK